MPETTATAARVVASRIRDQVARDCEQPALSVSIGVADYPEGGRTIEDLLQTADRELYGMKMAGSPAGSGQISESSTKRRPYVLSTLGHPWIDYRLAYRKIGKGRRIRADREHRNGYRWSSSRWFRRAPREFAEPWWSGLYKLCGDFGFRDRDGE